MNERIKELAEQAKQYAEDEQNNPLKIYTLDCFNEKFAELILHDCMSICESLGNKGMDGHYCVDEIRKEFGV